ncbi:MAG: FKBP-type peptidyl-prolyl cis-trans isomerase [Coriobacteriales bacterium]|jgi:FKBP-type peptidyl-prolyl cis-trans isomerase|nr:FKBP-type peptidyl-prolyl cis-trans isomerase [Coriobacteriales bacterium]
MKGILMRIVKSVLAAAVALVLAVGFVGCTKNTAESVAATVNGVEIYEGDINARIAAIKTSSSTSEDGTMDDVAWAKLLKTNGYTPETIREYLIRNQFAIYALILQKAAEQGITPDAATIDQSISDAKTGADDASKTWIEYLASMGFASEEAYRRQLEGTDVLQGLLDATLGDPTPSQEDIDKYVSERAAEYAGKRLSIIYLPYTAPTESEGEEADATTEETADETSLAAVQAKAQEALDKIKGGTDFSTVATEYSKDTTSAEKGGDIGWGSDANMPTEVKTVLDALGVNEVSDVIQSEAYSAYFIIKVTEIFTLPEVEETASEEPAAEGEGAEATGTEGAEGAEADGAETSTTTPTVDISLVPASLVETITTNYISTAINEAQQAYITALIESDEIVVKPMPSGLPYDVDMTLADTEETDDSSTTGEEADSGELVSIDTFEGTGLAAATGDKVQVHYTGYLADGTVFDSSYESGTPIEVTLGAGGVIQGWEQGIPGMKVGGKRTLTIPPSLAYGSAGNGSVIPPNATLTFEVELVSVNGDSAGYPADTSEVG